MSDDLQAQPGKRGNSYQMRRLTTEKCVILKVGQETCRTRSHGVCKDWMVWGAPREKKYKNHTSKSKPQKISSVLLVPDVLKRTTKDRWWEGKKSHQQWREREPLARACPLGNKLEWWPGTTFGSPLMSQWLEGILDLCDLYYWKLEASILGLFAGTWLAKYLYTSGK